ncbi:epimerase family protein SDR39U1 isoform X2 [Rousettus aegyptiacus]|uniref:epimerase family protein SDR39U1 isoform X2 n=2 Tax=Rousettus aegyptiacus TaxID=9407 RepID=UPI00168D696E|nr:epimerase family protein SDR39U1 isoform X2 [Rousettus aegyptiacus]
MRVLVGGGTGFIGTALTQFLKARGHEVTLVSRKPGPSRITMSSLRRGCPAAMQSSTWRERTPSTLSEAYYQPSLTAEYDEDSPGGDFDFFANLVTKWEAAAKLPGDSTRQVVVRSGIVLGRGGGAIGRMLLPFRLGLGGPIGSGRQFLPWIHIRDLVGILAHALEASHVQGVLNGVAPASTTTNAEFAQALGAALGRPAFIPLPSIIVQAIFGQERAIMLLEGQKVVPRRTLAAGYQYSFPELGAALKEIIA